MVITTTFYSDILNEDEYKDSNKEGHGQYIYKDNSIYLGTFKNNMRDGKGKYRDKKGNVYEGDWYQDIIS